VDERLAAVLPRLEGALGPHAGDPVALSGGITNRNFRVRLGGRDYVVRLTGKDTAVLGIEREAEVAATRAAHRLGLAPDVALFLPQEGCLVTTFVPGRPAAADELREEVAALGTALRLVHDGPALPAAFSAFRLGEVYRAETLARGGRVPAAYDDADALARRVEAAIAGHREHAPVPCHNDLLTANFIAGDDGALHLVDWEYAGMGDRFFDLGNLAVNNGLGEDDERALLDAYFAQDGGATGRRRAALRLMRLMSDYREAAWGVVQGVLSDLDFDYAAYADEHFARLLEHAADPRVEEWLDAARA
jgi:thiamine kinase-like enzyme